MSIDADKNINLSIVNKKIKVLVDKSSPFLIIYPYEITKEKEDQDQNFHSG